MVYLYTSFLNQINVYDYPTRFLFQNVTSFSVSVSDQILRKEKRREREREASSSNGGKREKKVRAAFEDPLRFLSLFFEERRKKKGRGGSRRGSNIYS